MISRMLEVLEDRYQGQGIWYSIISIIQLFYIQSYLILSSPILALRFIDGWIEIPENYYFIITDIDTRARFKSC